MSAIAPCSTSGGQAQARVICGQKNKHPEGHTQEKRCVPLRILRPLRETKFVFRERKIRAIRSIR